MDQAVQSEGFPPSVEALLDRADGMCAARGVRLTDLRRQVLGLILDRGRPAGAYDLLDRLRARRRGAAPPTVYRALDFLLEQGLIHRIERLSAFVGCVAPECDLDHAHDSHAAQFLICRVCKRATELDDRALEHAVAEAAGRVGFRIGGATVEVEGVCAGCAAGGGEAAAA